MSKPNWQAGIKLSCKISHLRCEHCLIRKQKNLQLLYHTTHRMIDHTHLLCNICLSKMPLNVINAHSVADGAS